MVLDITEGDIHGKGKKRKTRIVNIYDNKLGEGQTWQGSELRIRQAIEDFPWQFIMKRRVLIVGDMNAHSPIWNPHCHTRKNAGPLEGLTDSYESIVNNDPDHATRPLSQGSVSIIDLALTSPSLGPLCIWEIPEEYPSLSDHELILLGWEEMERENSISPQQNPTGWSIQKLLEDEGLLHVAKTAWMECSINIPYILSTSSKEDLDEEVEWFESNLSLLLDKHAKVLYVSPFSKRLWNKEVAKARKTWARAKKAYGRDDRNQDELKKARNTYYHVIRKAKRVCWQNFLQGQDKTQETRQLEDKTRC